MCLPSLPRYTYLCFSSPSLHYRMCLPSAACSTAFVCLPMPCPCTFAPTDGGNSHLIFHQFVRPGYSHFEHNPHIPWEFIIAQQLPYRAIGCVSMFHFRARHIWYVSMFLCMYVIYAKGSRFMRKNV